MLNSDLREQLHVLAREVEATEEKLANLKVLGERMLASISAEDLVRDPFSEGLGSTTESALQGQAIKLLRKAGGLAMSASSLYRTVNTFMLSIPGAQRHLSDRSVQVMFGEIGGAIRRVLKTLWEARRILTGERD